MSSNTDLTRDVYDAFSKGDVPTVLAAMAPDIRWEEPASSPYGDQTGPDAAPPQEEGAPLSVVIVDSRRRPRLVRRLGRS